MLFFKKKKKTIFGLTFQSPLSKDVFFTMKLYAQVNICNILF